MAARETVGLPTWKELWRALWLTLFWGKYRMAEMLIEAIKERDAATIDRNFVLTLNRQLATALETEQRRREVAEELLSTVTL